MKRTISIVLIVLLLVTLVRERPLYINAEETLVDVQSMRDYYVNSLVNQLDTGVYSYTNCVPSCVKIILNLHQIESESVHDIRRKIWYDSYGCYLYDAMMYIETYGLCVDWDSIDEENEIQEMLDEWYVICLVKRNGYNHCVVVAEFTDDKYIILDPLENDIIIKDTIGIIDGFVVYIDKEVADCNLD